MTIDNENQATDILRSVQAIAQKADRETFINQPELIDYINQTTALIDYLVRLCHAADSLGEQIEP